MTARHYDVSAAPSTLRHADAVMEADIHAERVAYHLGRLHRMLVSTESDVVPVADVLPLVRLAMKEG